jgi:hypothetical protein
VAILATVIDAGSSRGLDGHVPTGGFHAAFFTAAGLAALGMAWSLTVNDADAGATMHGQAVSAED